MNASARPAARRTRRTFPVSVTYVAPRPVVLTPAERRAAIFAPDAVAVSGRRER